MSEGDSASAAAATQEALAARQEALWSADRVLGAVVSQAHAVTVDALGRLDAISRDIESAVAQQDQLGLDTAVGAREFQHFLLARHHDIIDVVTAAAEEADKSVAEVLRLADLYRVDAGPRS
ncbi:MAG: hypothetical protein K0R68_3254 [Mycobacterium sp.]|jgi:hypothetical protein|nr:hypothetical protein [Mycobacterium sp.]